MPKKLSHYDARGQARMVDVSSKARTPREAEASAFVRMTPEVLRALPKNPKGDPLEVARTAGIMAAKRTAFAAARPVRAVWPQRDKSPRDIFRRNAGQRHLKDRSA